MVTIFEETADPTSLEDPLLLTLGLLGLVVPLQDIWSPPTGWPAVRPHRLSGPRLLASPVQAEQILLLHIFVMDFNVKEPEREQIIRARTTATITTTEHGHGYTFAAVTTTTEFPCLSALGLLKMFFFLTQLNAPSSTHPLPIYLIYF